MTNIFPAKIIMLKDFLVEVFFACIYKYMAYTDDMRKSITQEFDYGCGVACYAFALGVTYKDAEKRLGEKQAHSERFWVNDLMKALNDAGLAYERKYVKPHVRPLIDQEGVIVLIGISKDHPVGHYLIRHNDMWMDPWINLSENKNIHEAKSGFREVLPGAPMYAILPISS